MKYYLSSYRVGNKAAKLKKMISRGKKLGIVPNAGDYNDPKELKKRILITRKDMEDLGIKVEILDLKKYFGKEKQLKRKIDSLGGLWVRGGNVFVLRQAMRLSGLDNILKNLERDDFVYGGYSAAGCVLSDDLEYLAIVDNPKITPYKVKKVLWKGLGLIDFAFLPHYKSDHPESKGIDKTVQYCKKHKIRFKTLRDGEVIIIE